ncbi:MAG: hypothetical protein AAF411_08630 [Myxococcota bacterium]
MSLRSALVDTRRAGIYIAAMATKLTDQLVDKRLLPRNIEKGLIDEKGVEKHLSGLKDVSENLEHVPFVDAEEEATEGDAGTPVEAAEQAPE